jgi:hypothetical protein
MPAASKRLCHLRNLVRPICRKVNENSSKFSTPLPGSGRPVFRAGFRSVPSPSPNLKVRGGTAWSRPVAVGGRQIHSAAQSLREVGGGSKLIGS